MTTTELEAMRIRILGDARQYNQELEGAVKATEKAAQQIESVGRIAGSVATGLGLIGAASVHAFGDFNHAMTESTALIDLTEEQIQKLARTALDLGATSKAGPVKAAEAYYELFSAGMNAEQAMASLKPMMDFAAAGAFDLATSVALAEGALSALGLMSHDTNEQIANTARITDVLVKSSTLVSGSVEEFGRALTRDAAATMKAFNIQLEEGMAVLAAYHKQQIRGNQAGNTYGRMVRLVAQAATKKAAEFRKMNITVFDAAGNFRNFADILEDMEKAFADLAPEERVKALKRLGFQVLSQKALLPLVGQSKEIRRYQSELEKAGGTTEKVAAKQLKGFNNQLKLLINLVAVAATEIGEELAGAIKVVADGTKEAVKWWRDLNPAVKTTIISIGVMIGLTAALTVAIILAGKAFNFFFGGIGIIGGVIVTALAGAAVGAGLLVGSLGGIGKTMELLKQKALAAWEWLRPVREAVKLLFATILAVGTRAWETLKETALATWAAITGDAQINWTKVRDSIIGAIIAVEYAILKFEGTFQTAFKVIGFVVGVQVSVWEFWLKMILATLSALEGIARYSGNFAGAALLSGAGKPARDLPSFEEFKRQRLQAIKEAQKAEEQVASARPYGFLQGAMDLLKQGELKKSHKDLLDDMEDDVEGFSTETKKTLKDAFDLDLDAFRTGSAEAIKALENWRERMRLDIGGAGTIRLRDDLAGGGAPRFKVEQPRGIPADQAGGRVEELLEQIRDAVRQKPSRELLGEANLEG